MNEPTMIGMKLWDGYLSFDPDAHPEHSEDLRSWLENMSPEDLFDGLFHFGVPVVIDDWGEEGPVLKVVTDEDK